MSLFYFLHGKTPHPFDVISVYLLGLVAGLLVLTYQAPIEFKDWILGFLAADIVGGIVSNATESTRQQWREQSSSIRNLFLLMHVVIFPVIIISINGFAHVVSLSMLTGLLAKILIFKAGQGNKLF